MKSHVAIVNQRLEDPVFHEVSEVAWRAIRRQETVCGHPFTDFHLLPRRWAEKIGGTLCSRCCAKMKS